MPIFGSKGEFSKKDMNFFSEFTEKAAKMARMLAYVVIAVAAIIIVMIALIGFAITQNVMVQNDIDKIEKQLKDEKYSDLDIKYAELQNQITKMTLYKYALGEMRNTVDDSDAAKVELTHKIQANVPNEAYVTGYQINGTSVTIQGQTFNYYNAAEYVNLLQKEGIFTSVPQLSVEHVVLDNVLDTETLAVNIIDTYYAFTIQGTLTTDIHVSVKRFIEGDANTPIGRGEIGTPVDGCLVPGDSYSFDTIKTATQGSEVYTLSYVLIDGERVSDEEFKLIMQNDRIDRVVTSDVQIELYYKVGGEA